MQFTLTTSKKSLLLLLILLPLFLVSAFRNGLGTDYYAYSDMYNHPVKANSEPLFKFLFITLPRLISTNEITFFILTSFTVSYFFLKTAFQKNQLILLSVLIFFTQFYFISFNAVRQFVALSLFFYFGEILLREKRLVLFYVFVFLLAQIHFSMYILFLFPLLGYHNFQPKTYWLIWAISFFIFAVQSFEIINFSAVLAFSSKFQFLSSKFKDASDASTFFFGGYKSNTQLIIKNLLFIVIAYRLPYFHRAENAYWFNLFLFGIIAHNLLVKFSLFAVRTAYIGDIAMIMLVPIYICSFKRKLTRITLILLFSFYFSFSFYTRFVLNGESDIFKQGTFINKD